MSLLRTTATRGLSSGRHNFEASKQVSDGRRTNDFRHDSAAHVMSGDPRPNLGINAAKGSNERSKYESLNHKDAVLLTRIERLVSHQLQMLVQPAATGGSPDRDLRARPAKDGSNHSAGSHET